MFDRYTPLITTWSEILKQVEDQSLLGKLNSIRSGPHKQDNAKYCKFYRDHRHDTEDCFKLKEENENLIH